MSLSCDRGHSGKLIITRATTVAQTAPNYRDVLHCVARYNSHSGVQLSRIRTNAGPQHSTEEPGTGSNLSNHRRSQVVRVPNPPNSLSGFHQCLTAVVETGDLIAVQETQSNLWEPPWQPGSWGSIPCVHLLQRGKWQWIALGGKSNCWGINEYHWAYKTVENVPWNWLSKPVAKPWATCGE